MSNKEEIAEIEKKLSAQSKKTEETIEAKQKKVEQEQDNIITLQGYKNLIDCTFDYIHDAKDKADKMPENIFYGVRMSSNAVLVSEPTVKVISDESKKDYNRSIQHAKTMNATLPIAASGAYSIGTLAISNPQYFPNSKSISAKYQQEDELEVNIKYIKTELPNITPNIIEEFEAFVRKFRSTKPAEEKYLDLIGCRSMFFYKLIFKNARIIAGPNQARRDAVQIFASGGKPLDTADEPIINRIKDLWDELSGQDNSSAPNSVKLGDVTLDYNERLFRRVVSDITALLKLRNKYIP
jgi:hypothetical protein